MVGEDEGEVQTKWVVSIWILSVQRALRSSSADLISSTRDGGLMWPRHTLIPDVSLRLWVRTLTIGEVHVPAVVFITRWKVYSVSTSSPDSLVERLFIGLGIAATREPFFHIASETNFELARANRSHSNVTLVWVALRNRS